MRKKWLYDDLIPLLLLRRQKEKPKWWLSRNYRVNFYRGCQKTSPSRHSGKLESRTVPQQWIPSYYLKDHFNIFLDKETSFQTLCQLLIRQTPQPSKLRIIGTIAECSRFWYSTAVKECLDCFRLPYCVGLIWWQLFHVSLWSLHLNQKY